jgi:hypothetical protein
VFLLYTDSKTLGYQALIDATYKGHRGRVPRKAPVVTSSAGSSDADSDDDSESGDSVIGTTPRGRQIQQIMGSSTSYSRVELRLYRVTRLSVPPVTSYGSMFLFFDHPSSQDCFKRICERIATDCSFMIFQLPEDMSLEARVRIDRGSPTGESEFQRVLGIIQKAKKFPGPPEYRSVEVEVGLDLPVDEGG